MSKTALTSESAKSTYSESALSGARLCHSVAARFGADPSTTDSSPK
jgi:hypothetical protein